MAPRQVAEGVAAPQREAEDGERVVHPAVEAAAQVADQEEALDGLAIGIQGLMVLIDQHAGADGGEPDPPMDAVEGSLRHRGQEVRGLAEIGILPGRERSASMPRFSIGRAP